ncbi:aminotransferase class IV [Desulfococcaceae bacterium HSG9]|nr:aminotransferase class IV [Desulfococcaceae bacterium HSG9]
MSDAKQVWINGKFVPWEKATVHLMSHALSRGSAFFEVFGVHSYTEGPAAFRMSEHLDRLRRSAELLGMEMAYTKDEIAQAVKDTVKHTGLEDGHIKIMAYYSEEAFAVLVPESKLDIGIFAFPTGADLGIDINKPISACICKWRKIHPETVPIEAKACSNYLNGFLARQDAMKRGFDVGLMLDTDGYIAEGSIEACFMFKDGVLKVPPLGRVLRSISRRSIIEAAPVIGIEVVQAPITREEFMDADEIFTSATPFKVLPVGKLEDRIFADAPGPFSRKLAALMADIVSGRDSRFEHWFQPLY